jgi:hypothetical protein
MPQSYICYCSKCRQVQPDGRMVSRRTYLRHGVASDSSPHQSTTDQYFCRCSSYPNGHYFLTKRSYNRHLARLEDREMLISDDDDIALPEESEVIDADVIGQSDGEETDEEETDEEETDEDETDGEETDREETDGEENNGEERHEEGGIMLDELPDADQLQGNFAINSDSVYYACPCLFLSL